jgi:hypothetical protein
MDIENLFHILSYNYTIYNLTITAIGSITITYPVITHSGECDTTTD